MFFLIFVSFVEILLNFEFVRLSFFLICLMFDLIYFKLDIIVFDFLFIFLVLDWLFFLKVRKVNVIELIVLSMDIRVSVILVVDMVFDFF